MRKFFNHTLPFCLLLLFTCQTAPEETKPTTPKAESPKYSLGQWSFHKALFAGEMTNADFVTEAGKLGFDGVDYVNQFFADKVADYAFQDELKAAADAAGVEKKLNPGVCIVHL